MTHLRRELRHVRYSPEMKIQLQISNGAVTEGEYQLTQPFPNVAVCRQGTLQYFCLSETSLWGSWEAEDTDGGSKQQKQRSACRWPCPSMWSTRSEVRCYVRLFWINILVSLSVRVCAQMGPCMVFFSWRLRVSFELVCHQKESIAHGFIYSIFLWSCATCSTFLGPACCNGTIACSSPHRRMTWLLVLCCWCSSWLLSLGTWACVALGKGPAIPTKTDFAEPLMASDICLNMSAFYAKIS